MNPKMITILQSWTFHILVVALLFVITLLAPSMSDIKMLFAILSFAGVGTFWIRCAYTIMKEVDVKNGN